MRISLRHTMKLLHMVHVIVSYDTEYEKSCVLMDIREVARLLKWRAYIFTCSYATAWELWLELEEKRGFAFEEVLAFINNGKTGE